MNDQQLFIYEHIWGLHIKLKITVAVPLTSALKITASPLKGDILVVITIGKRLDAISGVKRSIEGYFSPLSIYRVDFLTQ